jgi:hypothetical protein
MRLAPAPVVIVAAVTATVGIVFFQSCAKGSSSGSSKDDPAATDNTTTQTTTVSDAAVAATATLADGSSVTVPAGVIPIGGTLTVEAAAAPAEFAVGDVATASTPIKLSATDASGNAITELSQAGTVALTVTPVAALVTVEAVESNLCALGLSATASKLVWRRAALSEVAATTAKFLTKFLGTFQLAYCGDVKLDGFTEMGIDGAPKTATPVASTLLAGKSCLVPDYKMCALYVGTDVDADIGKCESELGGTVGEGCDTAGAVGVCVKKLGSVGEFAQITYKGADMDAAACAQENGEFFKISEYTPTPAADQGPVPLATICGFEVAPTCDHDPTMDECTMFTGANWESSWSTLPSTCTSNGVPGVWNGTDQDDWGCNPDAVANCCVFDRGTADEKVTVGYTSITESMCANRGGELFTADGVLVPQ